MEKNKHNVNVTDVNARLEIEKHKTASIENMEKWQESEQRWKELKEFVKLKRTINPSNAQYLKVMNYIEHLESEGTD